MSGSDEEWIEEDDTLEVQQPCSCPFCSEVQSSGEESLKHCRQSHNIDLDVVRTIHNLDFYGWVRLINYIRKEQPAVSDLLSDSSGRSCPWDKEEYLCPVIPDDPLLQMDFDSDENTNMTSSSKEPSLSQRLSDTERQLVLTRTALDNAMKDLEQMREAMKQLTLDQDTVQDSETVSNEDDEDSYFTGYSYFGIHEEMLKDQVRMDAYQLFISRNSEIFKDKVVLDVGCGTGILSMFAVQAGARHVIAVDQSTILYKAIEIARENGLDNQITFIRGRIEDVILPVKQVDVIISEWMGYFLLFESMLDTVLYARDRWLKDCKQVYPNHCSISLVALGDEYEYHSKIKFWDDVRGFKMSCLREEVLIEPCIKEIDEYSLISSEDVIKKFDLAHVKPVDLDFQTRFSLTMKHNAQCHALVGYFDVGFEVPNYRVYFSTSPQDTPTHWKQTVFFLQEPIKVSTGDLLRGTFSCTKNSSNPRSLDIKISMELMSYEQKEPVKIEQNYILS